MGEVETETTEKEEVVEMEETKEEEVVEIEATKEEVVEMEEEIEVEPTAPIMESYTREEVDNKLNEIYDMIAKIKSEEVVEELDENNTQMSENPKNDRISRMNKKLEMFAKFTPKK